MPWMYSQRCFPDSLPIWQRLADLCHDLDSTREAADSNIAGEAVGEYKEARLGRGGP